MSLDELLSSYPAFFASDILPLSTGDKVTFIEENWYRISLYEALTDIDDVSSLLNKNNWSKVCSIKNSVAPTYSDFESIWPLYEAGSSYSEGDVVFVKSECEDASCAYISLEDVVNSTNISEGWEKIFCLSTGKNACSGYRRKKKPEEGYKLIKVGKGNQDYVEHPIPYKEYLGNIFKNCGCVSSGDLNQNSLVVWFEGRVNTDQQSVESATLVPEPGLEIEKYTLSMRSLVIPPSGETTASPILISDLEPEEGFDKYLNYRPAINKIDQETVLLSWESMNISSKPKGKMLSVYIPGPVE